METTHFQSPFFIQIVEKYSQQFDIITYVIVKAIEVIVQVIGKEQVECFPILFLVGKITLFNLF